MVDNEEIELPVGLLREQLEKWAVKNSRGDQGEAGCQEEGKWLNVLRTTGRSNRLWARPEKEIQREATMAHVLDWMFILQWKQQLRCQKDSKI